MCSTYSRFHIHGDNIVECERTFHLIELALGDTTEFLYGPLGSPVCPSFEIKLHDLPERRCFTLFPGFGRWHADILQLVRDQGGTLREAADTIITGVAEDQEKPLIAIEHCAALPAGNQAWQRNGRAYSFGLAGIPFLYVAEIGGYELDSQRARKAPRLPNPAVPFSYLSYSQSRKTPVLPVFTTSPGAGEESRRQYAGVVGETDLIALLRAVILDGNVTHAIGALQGKVLAFLRLRASAARGSSTLTPDQWTEAYNMVCAGDSLTTYLLHNAPIAWSKTAYIKALTDSAKQLMAAASQVAIGLTSAKLPMCVISPEKRAGFAANVEAIYPTLPRHFAGWLKREGPLTVCWLMGFKPRGDDARPDRGLPPLTRMLIGTREDLLTVVYGPAPKTSWSLLLNDPAKLVKQNGLWESIMDVSDAILVDSSTDTVTNHGFLREHWGATISPSVVSPLLVRPVPARIGENDVDTVLHNILGRLADEGAFEGMCNPPGGDWSGISLQTPDRANEIRWLSLPRVSANRAKRPDHVFQLFGVAAAPMLLAIESKERARDVEVGIGPRLKQYISELLASPGSIQRTIGSATWSHSSVRIDANDFMFASAVAFLLRKDSETQEARQRSKADLVLGFQFGDDANTCEICLVPSTGVGKLVAKYLRSLRTQDISVTFREVQ